MAKLLKLRRGTSTQHTTFTGAEGEVTVNTTNDSLHVHDGITAGGTELAKADLSNVDGSLSNNLGFADNTQAQFGTDNDLQIYHDGSASYITDTGAGPLYIRGTNLNIGDSGGYNFISCNDTGTGGTVYLYHQANEKLATTSSGINVTGSVTCDGLTSDGDITLRSANGNLIIKDTDHDGIQAQQRIIGQDSTNNTDWYVGQVGTGNNHLYISNNNTAAVIFRTASVERAYFKDDGHFLPWTDNTYDLGSASNQWRNGHFNGTVNCDGLTSEGSVTISAANGYLYLKDSDNDGVAARQTIFGVDSSGNTDWYVGQSSASTSNMRVVNAVSGAPLELGTNNAVRTVITGDGHLTPAADNTYDLGTNTNRWRNVYTNDLNLSNEGSANDVDGTWGSWTIQEGEDDLFLLNRRNGKKYKFNLSEVN